MMDYLVTKDDESVVNAGHDQHFSTACFGHESRSCLCFQSTPPWAAINRTWQVAPESNKCHPITAPHIERTVDCMETAVNYLDEDALRKYKLKIE